MESDPELRADASETADFSSFNQIDAGSLLVKHQP